VLFEKIISVDRNITSCDDSDNIYNPFSGELKIKYILFKNSYDENDNVNSKILNLDDGNIYFYLHQ
jgi:hypothetical protein